MDRHINTLQRVSTVLDRSIDQLCRGHNNIAEKLSGDVSLAILLPQSRRPDLRQSEGSRIGATIKDCPFHDVLHSWGRDLPPNSTFAEPGWPNGLVEHR